jgi:hypothetical protein
MLPVPPPLAMMIWTPMARTSEAPEAQTVLRSIVYLYQAPNPEMLDHDLLQKVEEAPDLM